jgi:hypothetical protein
MNNLLSTERVKTAVLFGAISALTLVIGASSFAAVFAQNPHFVRESCNVTISGTTGTLRCTGKIGGLGDVQTVSATLTAEGSTSCQTPGNGNEPPGQQGVPVSSGPQTFAVRNGAINYDQSVTVSGGKCNGQGLVFCATFTDVAVEIEGETLTIPGTFQQCR